MALANHLTPYDVQQAQEACQAMFRLNRHIRIDRTYSVEVYALKESLIQALYFKGYCQCVTLDAKGLGFLFEVGGARYLWHQPHVMFPVVISARMPYAPRTPESTESSRLTAYEVQVCMATVAQWLEAVR